MKKLVNLHQLAIRVSEREGLKKEMNIAQIKEVIRCIGGALYDLEGEQFELLLRKLVKPHPGVREKKYRR